MIETPRLIVRQWQDADLPAFAALNADPQVMRFFPARLTTTQSNQLAVRLQQLIDRQGWGFWAVALKDSGQFIGLTGLHIQPFQAAFPATPLLEIGWRLAPAYWRQGLAREAALAARDFAFARLHQRTLYAFTARNNVPSRQLMRRIGLYDLHQDFNHPALPAGHPLARHCLYRLTRSQWVKIYKFQ